MSIDFIAGFICGGFSSLGMLIYLTFKLVGIMQQDSELGKKARDYFMVLLKNSEPETKEKLQ